MRMSTTAAGGERHGSSDEEEEILVKNIETGEAENSKELIKDQQSLILGRQSGGRVWKDYLTSIQKMQDKLLQLVIHRSHQ
jgi:hypothetical protein